MVSLSGAALRSPDTRSPRVVGAPPSKPRALQAFLVPAVSFPDRRGGAVFNGPVTGEEPSCGRRVFILPTDRCVKRRDAEFHQSEALPWRIPPASETGGWGRGGLSSYGVHATSQLRDLGAALSVE